jgi:hypothetical protein
VIAVLMANEHGIQLLCLNAGLFEAAYQFFASGSGIDKNSGFRTAHQD